MGVEQIAKLIMSFGFVTDVTWQNEPYMETTILICELEGDIACFLAIFMLLPCKGD